MKSKYLRQIDELGRVVIPADLRGQYGFKAGEKVCLIACENIVLYALSVTCRSVKQSFGNRVHRAKFSVSVLLEQ